MSSVSSVRPIPDIEWQAQTNGTTSNLPLEIFYPILAHASPEPKDIVQVSLVCKQWRTLANSPFFWRAIVKSYSDITLNPDTHPKEQVQALFQKVKEANYPKEIITFFGGINRLAQIPTIQLPSDYKESKNEDHFQVKYQGQNAVVKFFASYNRPVIGIRYVHHVDQEFSNSNWYKPPVGRYEGAILLFSRYDVVFPLYSNKSYTWTFRDTYNPGIALELSWLHSPDYVQWLKKLLTEVPCGSPYPIKHGLGEEKIKESPALNSDNKPVYQLWSPTDDLSHV